MLTGPDPRMKTPVPRMDRLVAVIDRMVEGHSPYSWVNCRHKLSARMQLLRCFVFIGHVATLPDKRDNQTVSLADILRNRGTKERDHAFTNRSKRPHSGATAEIAPPFNRVLRPSIARCRPGRVLCCGCDNRPVWPLRTSPCQKTSSAHLRTDKQCIATTPRDALISLNLANALRYRRQECAPSIVKGDTVSLISARDRSDQGYISGIRRHQYDACNPWQTPKDECQHGETHSGNGHPDHVDGGKARICNDRMDQRRGA